MNESRCVPVHAVIRYALWLIVVGSIAGSWALVAAGHPSAAAALGFTACVPCSLAIVLTIRTYVVRMCNLIRSLHGMAPGLPSDLGADLRGGSVRPIR